MFDVQITGDASAGRVIWQIDRDPRFEHIVSFMSIESDNAAAIDYILGIKRKAGTTFHNVGKTNHSGITGNLIASIIWSPPTMIDPIQWIATVDNTDTELYKFKGMVYNFNIRASERTSLAILLASIPRSPSTT